MNQPEHLTWSVDRAAGVTTVTFRGTIDEDFDPTGVAADLEGVVAFDLENVNRINSCGVREWIKLLGALPRVRQLYLDRCSEAIVRQLNMVGPFRGGAIVRSVVAPYHCGPCDADQEQVLDLASCFPAGVVVRVPEVVCAQCGGPAEFDDTLDRYFFFVR